MLVFIVNQVRARCLYQCLLCLVVVALPTHTLYAQAPPDAQRYDEVRQALFEATNRWRSNEGVRTLTRDSRIDELIQRHVEDKAACGIFYRGSGGPGNAHDSCDGTTFGGRVSDYFASRPGGPSRSSENMGGSTQTGMAIVDPAITGWANSPGHQRNMIDSAVGVLGVGYAEGFIGESDGRGGLRACSTAAARDAAGHFTTASLATARAECLSGSVYGQVFASIDPAQEGFFSAATRMAEALAASTPPASGGGSGGGTGGGTGGDTGGGTSGGAGTAPLGTGLRVAEQPSSGAPRLFSMNTGSNLARLDSALTGLYVYYGVLNRMDELHKAADMSGVPASLPQEAEDGWPELLGQYGFNVSLDDLRNLFDDTARLRMEHDQLGNVFTEVLKEVTDMLSNVTAADLIADRLRDGNLNDEDIQELQELLEPLYDSMNDSMDELRVILRAISPGEYDAAARSGRQLSLSTARVAFRRLARLRENPSFAARTNDKQPLVASTASVAEAAALMGLSGMTPRTDPGSRPGPTRYHEERTDLATWAQAYGSFAYQDKENSLPGYDHLQHGLLVGADRPLGEKTIVGAYAGLGRMDTSYETPGSEHEANQFSLGLYGMVLGPSERSYLDLGLGIHIISHEQQRGIQIGLLGLETASADYDSLAFSVHAGGGMLFDIRNLILEPTLTLEYLYHDVDGFSEAGNTPLLLAVDSQETQNLNARVGLNLYREFVSGNGYAFVPRVGFQYLLESSIGDRDIPARFAIAPGANNSGLFVIQGRDGVRHYYQQDIGVQINAPNGRLQAHGDYSLVANGTLSEHQFNVGLRYKF